MSAADAKNTQTQATVAVEVGETTTAVAMDSAAADEKVSAVDKVAATATAAAARNTAVLRQPFSEQSP